MKNRWLVLSKVINNCIKQILFLQISFQLIDKQAMATNEWIRMTIFGYSKLLTI